MRVFRLRWFLPLLLVAGVVLSESADAKMLGISPLGANGTKKVALNYPTLPEIISNRIKGLFTKAQPAPLKVDEAFSRDWALTDIGFFEAFTPLVQPINPETQPCSDSIVVAVIDTGIDYTHTELQDHIWINKGETGPWTPSAEYIAAGGTCRDKSCNGIDDDGDGYVDDVVGWDFVHDTPLPYDTHGHGTHIAGIISGDAANGIGAAGVCPHVTIMPLKYYDNSGSGYNNLTNTVRAIQYAVKKGANIINYSGGGAEPADAERAAIEEARGAGILFVAAAGNDGHNNEISPYFPASYNLDNIVGVASINQQNQLLPSSNWGKNVQMAAPGLMILSSLPEGKFGTMSGTSQATAFVTGAAALLESQSKEKGKIDYHKIKQWLAEGAKPVKGNDSHKLVSAGVLNVAKSLDVEREELRHGPKKVSQIALRPSAKHDKVQ